MSEVIENHYQMKTLQQKNEVIKTITHTSADQFDNAFEYIKDGEFGHVKDAFKMRNPGT